MTNSHAEILIQNIHSGQFDEQLNEISSAIYLRRQVVARMEISDLRVGDPITFSDKIRPAYLRGLKARVKKVNGASVVVDLDNNPSYGRFAGHRNVRVPATLVQKG